MKKSKKPLIRLILKLGAKYLHPFFYFFSKKIKKNIEKKTGIDISFLRSKKNSKEK